jgi:hypothetical protein
MTLKIQLVASYRWPFPIHLASAFSHAACIVEATTPRNHVLAMSRHVARWRWYNPLRPLQSLEDAIVDGAPDLLVPCDDRAVQQLVEVFDRGAGEGDIAEAIERSLGAVTSYLKLASRSRSMSIAREAGVPAPATDVVRNLRDVAEFAGKHGFPIVLKTDGSFGGRGVVIAKDLAEAKRAFERLRRPPSLPRVLGRMLRSRDLHLARTLFVPGEPVVNAQAYVPGRPANTAMACWRGRLLAAVHVDVIEERWPNGPATVVRPVDRPAMQEAAERIARRFNLSGLHGLDFVHDARCDVSRLVEINPRATPTSHFARGEGRDPVVGLISEISGGLAKPARSAIPADSIALFPQEWLRDPQSAHIANAHQDIPREHADVLHACLNQSRWIAGGKRTPALREFSGGGEFLGT